MGNLDLWDGGVINAIKDGQSDAYIAEQFGVTLEKVESLKGYANEVEVSTEQEVANAPQGEIVNDEPVQSNEPVSSDESPVEVADEATNTEVEPEVESEVVAEDSEVTPENA